MRTACTWPGVFLTVAFIWTTASCVATANQIVFENAHFRYTLGTNAANVAFVDRATGRNYLRTESPSACAFVWVGGNQHHATAATLVEGRLKLRFGGTDITAVLRTETHPSCIVFNVESVSGGQVDSLTFLNIPLSLKGSPEESFGACALAQNLITRVDALPALHSHLRATGEKKFGIVSAKVAVVGAPMARMLPTLQETLKTASELPVCQVAGPWAHEIPFNHGSYLFNFGSLTETNLQGWIEMIRSLGFTQIDNHGGGSFFRFGDMELNREKWPDGWESWRRIVARLHAEGIGSIFHTYAFFIDKQSKYVTPVPDPRLDAFRTFTLAQPLTADATEVLVNESTAGLSTITGFFEHNSVVLHIGDELVTFGGFSKESPWKFTGVKRGAHGTQAAAHGTGVAARHLKECFGLFVPDVDSSLFEEIAGNHAEVVKRCGFDGIYLDAIDGSSILRGADECWYWANKFVVEIQKRLDKPVGMEMSAMWHHFWQYRTRWQAWDYPQRGHKRFIDLHAEEVNGGLLLPLHLGWWNFQAFNPPQLEPSYPDVMEYLGAKLIGWNAGVSLTAGVNRETLRKTPLFQRAVEILRRSEELRHTKAFDEATRLKLREPGREFVLFTNATGKLRFRRMTSQPQRVAANEPWTLTWNVTNAFGEQPARFRVEALMSADDTSAEHRIPLMSFAPSEIASSKRTSAAGVTVEYLPWSEDQSSGCLITVTNSGIVPQKAAWARIQKIFDPPINLTEHQGLSVNFRSETGGAIAAIRLESPKHLAYGAVADRYFDIESNVRRRVTLVETEPARWSDYIWNDGKGLYNVYRETISFSAVESISLWLQDVVPGREIKVSVGPIAAIPLNAVVVKHPRLTVAGTHLEFPVELSPGSWIEANGPDDCEVYGSKGEALGKIAPGGDWPVLKSGITPLTFTCKAVEGPLPRAKVVIFLNGEEL